MAPIKVIVQGIPTPQDAGKIPETCTNENGIELEQLFTTYGPVKCLFLWSNECAYDISSPYKRRRIMRGEIAPDNFAHLMFEDANNAAMACQAANNHQIKLNNSILTLTPLPESIVPIEILDDNSLIKIFSFLDVGKRLEIEEVCSRWRELAKNSWSDVKEINLRRLDYIDEECEVYLIRCGRYLENIICEVQSSVIPNLILKHCRQIQALEINTWLGDDEEDVLSEMFMGLRNLKSLKLNHEQRSFEFHFLQNLPASLENIHFSCGGSCNATYNFDLSRFRDLKSLALRGYLLFGGNHVMGIEHMEKLTHVDFYISETYRSLTRQFEQLTRLKKLIIPKSGINDDILIQILMNNPDLELLDISEADALTDRSVQLVSTLANLEDLDISLLSVTLNFMDRMPSLRELKCRECEKLTDEALGRLIQLAPNLRSLEVAHSSVTPGFFAIANVAVEKRTNNVSLLIGTSYRRSALNHLDRCSPLLQIAVGRGYHRPYWEREYPRLPNVLNDEYDDQDIEYDDEVYMFDEDSEDDEDDVHMSDEDSGGNEDSSFSNLHNSPIQHISKRREL